MHFRVNETRSYLRNQSDGENFFEVTVRQITSRDPVECVPR